MQEAKASVNFYGVTGKGWNCQFTIRDDNEVKLMERFGAFVQLLEGYDVTPKAVGQQPSATSVSQSTPPPAKSTDAEGKWYDGEFAAVNLLCEMRGGKTYWKLDNVPGTKFDVNIWPEVLSDAGFEPDALDPAQVYSLKGFTARYQNNEKGYPYKIVELFETKGNVQVTKSTPPRQEA